MIQHQATESPEPRSHRLPDPAPPAPGKCPRRSSPAVLWEETRPKVNSASSACPAIPAREGVRWCTCTKQPLLPELLISLPCLNSIPSGPVTASGSQLGVTGSPDSWQEVGVGWLQVYRGGTDIRRAGEHARCYRIGRFRKRETWRRWRLDSSLRQ